MKKDSWLSEHGSTWFIGLVLAGSLAGNVLQAWKNQAVGAELTRLSSLVPRGGVKEGTRLPSLSVLDRNGVRSVLRLGGETTVLYLVSQTCSWCTANEANIRALALHGGQRLRFVTVSLQSEGLAEYAVRSKIPTELVGLVEDATVRADLGLDVTPQTIVVAADGTVERVWTGAWLGKMGEEVGQYFNATLPGVTTPEKAGAH